MFYNDYNDYNGLYVEEVTSLLVVVRDVVADVLSRNSVKPVVAKQNDASSRFLNVRIQENGKDMNIDSTCSVVLNVQRPDGSVGMIRGSINEDGTVRVGLSSWVLEQAGTVSCDISVVREDSTKLTTMTFYVEVEPAVCCDGDIIDTEDYSVLVDLINDTQNAYDLVNEAAEQATATVRMCADATAAAIEATKRIDGIIGTTGCIIPATVE